MNVTTARTQQTTPGGVVARRGARFGPCPIRGGSDGLAGDDLAVGWSDTLRPPVHPDLRLPTQPPLAPDKSAAPERRLMAAILEDAIACYLRNTDKRNKRARLLFLEAECWLFASSPYWVFSFEGICDTLGLDAGYVRSGLARSKQRPSTGSHGSEPLCDPSVSDTRAYGSAKQGDG